MATAPIRVLVVDDNEPWRHFYSSTLQREQELQIVGEASDGLEAVRKARVLQPDLILLDIGLPELNGIEVARQIRNDCPASKILFVSENRSIDIAKEALSTGAGGYVLKSDAAGELLLAIRAVVDGRRFVSAGLGGYGFNELPDSQTGIHFHRDNVVKLTPKRDVRSDSHHEVRFCSDDRHFLDGVTPFICAALKSENAAIVVATESHRKSLVSELEECGFDVGAAIEQGRYIQLDAAETLSMFMVNGMPDEGRFLELLGDLIVMAGEAAYAANPRVSLFGECVNLLCRQGNAEAAIKMEKLGNKLIKIHNVEILCGYLMSSIEVAQDSQIFERICAEHSAVYSQ